MSGRGSHCCCCLCFCRHPGTASPWIISLTSMETIQPLPPTEKKITCYHCGDVCTGAPVIADGHAFCCEGCKLVFELLKENNLCTYYDLTKAPGHAATDPAKRSLYASLDDAAVRSKLIRFEHAAM